jgi:very-short-patch-repair endonuclease
VREVPTASRRAAKHPSGRWAIFRRLCAYYVDCLLQDDSYAARGYLDRENETWITVRQPIRWARLADAGFGVTLALTGDQRAIQPNRAKMGDEGGLYLGYPTELVRTRNGTEWVVPLFLLPMQGDWQPGMIALEPDGPAVVNTAWAEGRFRSSEEMAKFSEIVGLSSSAVDEDGEDGVGPVSAADLGVLGQRAGDYLSSAMVGQIAPASLTRPDWSKAASGIHNAAVLLLGPRLKYTRGLVRELRDLGEWPDGDLDLTALASLFPHDMPTPAALSASTHQRSADVSEPGPPANAVVQFSLLDMPQRQAVERALTSPASVLTGPPGSGKSVVVRSAVVNEILRGRPVLFASKNHRALDAVVPAVNALAGAQPLVIRTSSQDIALKSSWKKALRELLCRPDESRPEAVTESQGRLGSLLAHVSSALATLDVWQRDEEAYDALNSTLDELKPRLPSHLRDSDEALASWPAEVRAATLDELHASLLRTVAPARGLLECVARLLLWPWRRAERRRLEESLRRLPLPAIPRSLDVSAENVATWEELFGLWKAWAEASSILGRRRALENRLASAPARSVVMQDLAAAHSQATSTANTLLTRLAGGQGFPLSGHEREAMTNLRAGMANLGDRRFMRHFNEQFATILRAFPAWACSSLSMRSSLPLVPGVFDLAIIDEASQCDIASSLPILARARRVMIVGDPRQLQHVSRLSQVAERQLLEVHGLTDLSVQRFTYRVNSLFDLAHGSQAVSARGLLSHHYRCHPQIAEYANTAFYGDALNVATITDRLRVPPGTRPGLHWLHTAGTIEAAATGVICNDEIAVIRDRLLQLMRDGFEGSVGVVTPFAHQRNRINDELSSALPTEFHEKTHLLVDTVHGFQGDERDLMLMSLCCGPGMPSGALRFVAENPNLFNVAVTRARAVLEIVGNRDWAAECGVGFIQACVKRTLEGATPPTDDVHESPWERVLSNALRAAGIETIPQYRIAGRRLDLAVLGSVKLDVEVDGEAFHRTASGARKDDDLWRDLQLESLGWKVLRFWVYEVRDDVARCVETVKKALGDPRQ